MMIGIEKVIVIIALLCIIGAGICVYINNRRTKRLLDSIEKMVETARSGAYTESSFDETQFSKLETKLSEYLSASELSARNVASEKDRIKELTADISHQTKTPIANLLLYSELLKEELDKQNPSSGSTESAHEYLDAIFAQSEKLRFLIDSLVKLSRLETGVFVLNPEARSVDALLEEINAQFASKAEKHGLKLSVYHLGDHVANTTVDKASEGSCEIVQSKITAVYDLKWTLEALGNIVDNAIKYTRIGGRALAADIEISANEYPMFVCIRVKDRGIGISEEELGQIFTRFYRSERVRNIEGVGIGLFLAREILACEGGYIKVKSEEGKGSTFEVFLPKYLPGE